MVLGLGLQSPFLALSLLIRVGVEGQSLGTIGLLLGGELIAHGESHSPFVLCLLF